MTSFATGSLQWGHVQVNVETAMIVLLQKDSAMLQWGHVQVNVETERDDTKGNAQSTLQWGHVQVNVETWGQTVWIPNFQCFNGATFR